MVDDKGRLCVLQLLLSLLATVGDVDSSVGDGVGISS